MSSKFYRADLSGTNGKKHKVGTDSTNNKTKEKKKNTEDSVCGILTRKSG